LNALPRMIQTYSLNGLKLDSDFRLAALAPWRGRNDVPPDIVIRLGQVPPRLDRPDHVAPIFQTRGGREYLLTLRGTGRVLVRNGEEILVQPEADADPSAVLSGPVQAVLWHQRGLLPLHASVIAVGDRAIALSGHSTAGKSTLAAVLAGRGHTVIADDICVVDGGVAGGATVLAGSSRLRLWRDALDFLGIDPQTLERAAAGKQKYVLDCGTDCRGERRPLAAVIVLSRQTNGSVTIERLRGAGATGALHGVVHMRRPARALARGPAIFASLTRLIAAGVTVWRLKVPDGADHLADAARLALGVLEAPA
jgi:hypothetical protein